MSAPTAPEGTRPTTGDEQARPTESAQRSETAEQAEHAELSIRNQLLELMSTTDIFVTLLMVADHRNEPEAFEVPISSELADQLVEQALESISAAGGAELRPSTPGFKPDAHQWVYQPKTEGPLSAVEAEIVRPTLQQYDRGQKFGRQNLLVLRLRDEAGVDIAQLCQGFSPEKDLAPKNKILALWQGERFATVGEDALVIDRKLRLIVLTDHVVMSSDYAYESIFGALPGLRQQAAETYRKSLGQLPIVGGEELAQACASDMSMMKKLLSIEAKLSSPEYADALKMDRLLVFLDQNPQLEIPIDRTGPEPALVFQKDAQHRWQLLKLLDDDYLRSDLTDITYEANSKTRFGD